ncbi:MAG TPA: amidase, partial [Candidatus Dormibacteraeota bacterium]|nr:amidase [Candidatus Dormibacteraeota bacterium]
MIRWLAANETARRVRASELEPRSVVDAHLGAIEQFDPRIHAYIYVDRDAAPQAGSYSGVTVAVKDSQPVRDMPFTYATPSWRDRVATEDSIAVALLRRWGVTVLGKTNLPELAAAIGTTNTLFPATQNPWREGITPGGSSGGSAAAVASGMCTFAIGGDMGGSIRIPASCCGVVGLRATPERIGGEEVDPTVLQAHGPLARTIDDARVLFSMMSGTEPPVLPGPGNTMHIGMTTDGAHPACADACLRAAGELRKAGHRVDEIPWDPNQVTAGYAVVRRASMASFPADLSTFGPGIRKLAAEGRELTAMDHFHAMDSATAAANRCVGTPLRTEYDFLLTPTLGLPPMKIEDVPPFLGDAWATYVRFVLPVSFARVPAISIPAGLHEGLPIGVQLVGQFAQEYDLLAFAEELERMPGFGFQRP